MTSGPLPVFVSDRAPIAAPPTRYDAIRLRGRDREIARIDDLLQRVLETSSAGGIAIEGAAGIGKTALLNAMTRIAAAEGFAIARSAAEEARQIAPMAPLLLALRCGPTPVLSRRAFESLSPYRDHPLWLIDRIIGMIEEEASKRPLLIAIDDAQWSDRLTQSCLRIMPPRLVGLPIVWAVISRESSVPTIDAWEAGALNVHHVHLASLSDADIERIVADRLGCKPTVALRRKLKSVGGNPFFAAELMNGLTESISESRDDTPARRKPAKTLMKPLTGWASLTRTELRVAKLIAEGHTNRSAARELALSVNTIATHLRAIFGKLAVNSRVQLTRAFLAIEEP